MDEVKNRTIFGISMLSCAVFLCLAGAALAQTDVDSGDDVVLVDGLEVPLVNESNLQNDDWYTVEGIPGGGRVSGDFVVGPGKVELEVAPGQSKTILISVTNRTGEQRDFELSTEDMTGSRDPLIGMTLLGSVEGPYSLRDYIKIAGTKVTLKHNERARIPVTISVPADADPGGRYGSVLVRTLAVEGSDGIENELVPQSPIIARIGTLFFVTVPGEAEREGKLLDFTIVPKKSWFEKGPFTFNILFENTGSVHLAPYGSLSITNTFGQEVGVVELDPWFVMPLSLRSRDIEWTAERLLGRYTATLNIHHGYDNVSETKSVTFWVMPWKVVVGTFVVVFLFIFFMRSIFRNFEFRRKT